MKQNVNNFSGFWGGLLSKYFRKKFKLCLILEKRKFFDFFASDLRYEEGIWVKKVT